MARLRTGAFVAAAMLLSSASASPEAQDADSAYEQVPIGGEVKLCAHCPAFVRVPSAPADMRRIQFVSKYELTWNQYLAAVDAGGCALPKPYRAGLDAERLEISNQVVARNLDKYRIDWPIAVLGVADVECYLGWLQSRTAYKVTLPTEKEWEWFARAGKTGAKYPWGDDRNSGHEALPGSKIAYEDEVATPDIHVSHANPIGVKVGLFPANAWGLHDIMGNVFELTSDRISGEEWLRSHPAAADRQNAQPRDRVIVKGGDRRFGEWQGGISKSSYAVIFNGRYSIDAGVRLILSK